MNNIQDTQMIASADGVLWLGILTVFFILGFRGTWRKMKDEEGRD